MPAWKEREIKRKKKRKMERKGKNRVIKKLMEKTNKLSVLFENLQMKNLGLCSLSSLS